MTLRVSDEDYMRHVDKWWSVLLPKISRFLYSRGGPIVLAQASPLQLPSESALRALSLRLLLS